MSMTPQEVSDEARAFERARLRALLEDAVDGLFVNGSGQRATRLVLFCDATQRDLGGWCKGAILDRLLAALDKEDA